MRRLSGDHVVSNEEMARVMTWLVGSEQRLLLGLMLAMEDGNAIATPQGEVAAAIGIEAGTASRALKGLKAAGVVRVVRERPLWLLMDPHVAWRGSRARRLAAIAEWEAGNG